MTSRRFTFVNQHLRFVNRRADSLFYSIVQLNQNTFFNVWRLHSSFTKDFIIQPLCLHSLEYRDEVESGIRTWQHLKRKTVWTRFGLIPFLPLWTNFLFMCIRRFPVGSSLDAVPLLAHKDVKTICEVNIWPFKVERLSSNSDEMFHCATLCVFVPAASSWGPVYLVASNPKITITSELSKYAVTSAKGSA